MQGFGEKVSFIWSVADLLRGDYKPAEYADVILPLIVLRRLDCVLEPTKSAVVARHAELTARGLDNPDQSLRAAFKLRFYNTSPYDFNRLLDDPRSLADNLRAYLNGFSENVRDLIEKFGFLQEVDRLARANVLLKVVEKFGNIDLHPDAVGNHEMGYIFEELIRRFNEQSNETAGEHFTPREVIRLMVNLLFAPERETLAQPGIVRTVYDPACGTGGMLTTAKDHIQGIVNANADIRLFGQELNPKSYAVCKADMLIKGEQDDHIKQGNSFSEDHLSGNRFDYMLSNPPFGVEWKKVQEAVKAEAKRGTAGRFGAGLPRINDGSFLFLQHLIAKMLPPEAGGGRIAIVFNGSPLFTGDAGSGESEIRRWILENDWLEAIVAMPDQLFYNTGIHTYVWIVTNRKEERRRGFVQLVNAVGFGRKMRRSLGNKRNEIAPDQIADITRIYDGFTEGPHCKIFPNEAFGYRRVVVERPLRLAYAVSPERLATLAGSPPVQKALAGANGRAKPVPAAQLGLDGSTPDHDTALGPLGDLAGFVYPDRSACDRAVTAAFAAAGRPLPATLKTAILDGLATRDESAPPVPAKKAATNGKGPRYEPDPELRDTENVPLGEDVHAYLAREVLPHVPDAWLNETVRDEKDGEIGKVGYEIPFTRHFYEYTPLRPLEEIDAEIKTLEAEILAMLQEVTA